MENYRKGKNVEESLEQNKIPIKNLPENFLWMQVRGGSKIRNLLTQALNEFPKMKNVVWTGFGPSVGKCITCAEIMKREYKNSLHQITKLCYRKVEEYWDPLLPDLDQLVVKRKLPMIHIYLSEEPIDPEEPGYQAPGVYIPHKAEQKDSTKNRKTGDKKIRKPNKKQDNRLSSSANSTSTSSRTESEVNYNNR